MLAMSRLSLAACAVAFHLCLLFSSSSSLRWLSDKAAAVSTAGYGSVRTRSAYHFQPAKNWQNDPNGTTTACTTSTSTTLTA